MILQIYNILITNPDARRLIGVVMCHLELSKICDDADFVIAGGIEICLNPAGSSQRSVLTHFPQCRIYASVNRVSICSDNGLSPIRHQAII